MNSVFSYNHIYHQHKIKIRIQSFTVQEIRMDTIKLLCHDFAVFILFYEFNTEHKILVCL